jgi:prolyl 4-hydroxylase
MLLAWNNMDADGMLNSQTLHESLPVTAGIKNIVTKWYRERFWL